MIPSKALTIKNPWAYLIALGLKDIENRSRQTHFRGTIYIHAAQKIDHRFRAMNLLFTPAQWKCFTQKQREIMVAGIFPSCAIIGQVDIVDCVRDHKSVWAEPDQWHWVLANAKMYDKPILNVKGKLSFWQFKPNTP